MEGPSLHILAQKLTPFVGQKITKSFGNTSIDKAVLVGQSIREIYPFGKRLIIQCDTHVVVIHFLMYGTYRITTPRENMPIRLALVTKKYALFLYNCSIRCVPLADLRSYIPFEFDILSSEWTVKKIMAAIAKQRNENETVDDLLLDQTIFAGVGNIIKNEALFMSKLSPHALVKKLSVKKLTQLVKNTRKFSEIFLESRKDYQLKKQLQIYRKITCPVCGTKIIRQKTGKRNRWSFWCPHCQNDNGPKS